MRDLKFRFISLIFYVIIFGERYIFKRYAREFIREQTLRKHSEILKVCTFIFRQWISQKILSN